MLVFLSSSLYALCIKTKRNFVNKEQREDNSLKLPMGRMSLAMS